MQLKQFFSQNLLIRKFNFEIVKNFTTFRITLHAKNAALGEIKRRAGWRKKSSYLGLSKIMIYKIIIILV